MKTLCGAGNIPTADDLRAELRALMGSFEYAYAMGHGCSLGDHPESAAVRRRVDDLRAMIAELSE